MARRRRDASLLLPYPRKTAGDVPAWRACDPGQGHRSGLCLEKCNPGARLPISIGALRLATRPRARTAPPRTRIAPSTMGLIVKSEINNTLYLILSFIAVFSIPVISFVKKQMAQLGNGPKVVVGTGYGGKDGSYTAADVAKHKTQDDLWLIIDGNVYDVTEYVDEHPAGSRPS